MKKIVLLNLIVCSYISIANASIYSMNVNYGGCNICPNAQYSLSNGIVTCNNWNGGERYFNNPLPANSLVHSITIKTTRVLWCSQSTVNVKFTMNDINIGNLTSDLECSCNNSSPILSVTSETYLHGFPGFNYANYHTIKALPIRGDFGVGDLEIIFDYSIRQDCVDAIAIGNCPDHSYIKGGASSSCDPSSFAVNFWCCCEYGYQSNFPECDTCTPQSNIYECPNNSFNNGGNSCGEDFATLSSTCCCNWGLSPNNDNSACV